MFLKILIVAIFVAVTVAVGIFARKHSNSVDGFVLGGRNVGPWLSAFAFGTSYFSAVVFIGYAGQFGWKYGMSVFWVGIGNAVIGSLLAWWVLGPRTREMTQRLKATTMPEFFGKRYNSRALRIAAAAIIFVFLIPYTASVYNGLSRLFGMAFGLPYEWCVIGMAVVTCIYVVLGGYVASVWNDFIQGTIMLIGIIAVIFAVLNGQGGIATAIVNLSQIPAEGSAMAGPFTSMFGPDALNLLGVIILTSLGTWALPQMVQKFYAIKSETAVHKGMIISTVFALIVAGGCYFLGGFGRLFSDQVDVAADGYDSIIPTMLSGLPDVLIAIVVILVLSASMSTLSSLVLASSSTLTLDFLKDNFVKDMKEKTQVLIMRVLIVIFIAISVVIAIVQYRSNVTFIAQLMGISWGALAGAFLAPFLYGLYWKKATKAGCWASFLFSVVVMLANMLAPQLFPAVLRSSINAGAFCMLAGLIIVPVVSLVTPKPDQKLVDDAFSCYDQKVLVRQREALGDGE